MLERFVIEGLNVYTETGLLPEASVTVQQGLIVDVDTQPISRTPIDQFFHFPKNWHLVPGMIDVHIHGSNGIDVLNANASDLGLMARSLLKEGVTGFLPTLVTAPNHAVEKSLSEIKNCVEQQKRHPKKEAQILGINLEGPFLSKEKAGAQHIQHMQEVSIELFQHWQDLADQFIKIMTVAPEVNHATELIEYLAKNRVIVSCGHTHASYEQTKRAIDSGITQATHLFNAMTPIHHRAPGPVVALLMDDRVTCELIADCYHVHEAMLDFAFRIKGADQIILMSDAISAKNMPDGIYNLGAEKVLVHQGIAKLHDGTLAGSTLTLDQAARNMMRCSNCSLMDIVKMTAENPAKKLNLFEQFGSIRQGKKANLVVLDDQKFPG